MQGDEGSGSGIMDVTDRFFYLREADLPSISSG